MHGLHLTADLYRCRCDAAWLSDAPGLGAWCQQAMRTVGLAPVAHLFEPVPAPGGVSGTAALGDARVGVHTWPAERAVTLDVFVLHSGDGPGKARALMTALVDRFQPEWTEQRSLDRGEDET